MSPNCFASYSDAAAYSGVSRDPIEIVFAGRLSPEKSPIEFVSALAVLRDRGKPFRASILGAGPMQEAVEQRIRTLALSESVRTGHIPDITPALLRATVFVSLQTSDNYPSQALLEAMGAGCAVIASDVGETWRLVDENVGQRVPLNAVAIADAIGILLDDPVRTRRLGEAASQRVRSQFSEDRYMEFLEGLYDRARARFTGQSATGYWYLRQP